MNELEKGMLGHLSTFPERRKELLDFQQKTNENFSDLKRQIEINRTHTEPSPKTLIKIQEMKDVLSEHLIKEDNWKKEIRENQELLTRAVFGEKDKNGNTIEIGMHQQTSEMYKKLIQVDGIKGFFKWILLTGSVTSILYLFFKKF